MKLTREITAEQQTQDLAKSLAKYCSNSLVIYLEGNLGAGKTTLCRYFIEALGHKGPVKSPTYTLVEAYTQLSMPVFHFDLYRLSGPEELEDLGFRDYFDQPAVILIEWPERAGHYLPQPDLCCYITLSRQTRNIQFEAHTESGHQLLQQLNEF